MDKHIAENNKKDVVVIFNAKRRIQTCYFLLSIYWCSKLAGVLGFEPRYAGIKTLCLTAWRHPNTSLRYEGYFAAILVGCQLYFQFRNR